MADIGKNNLVKLIVDGFANMPFSELLGIHPQSFDAENGCIRFSMQGELAGDIMDGTLHRGVISAILDIEGGFILALGVLRRSQTGPTETQRKGRGGTINLRIDHLMPGKGRSFVASGTILSSGSEIGAVRTELRNDQDQLIAVGTGTYLID